MFDKPCIIGAAIREFKTGPLKTAKDQNLMLTIKHMVNIP